MGITESAQTRLSGSAKRRVESIRVRACGFIYHHQSTRRANLEARYCRCHDMIPSQLAPCLLSPDPDRQYVGRKALRWHSTPPRIQSRNRWGTPGLVLDSGIGCCMAPVHGRTRARSGPGLGQHQRPTFMRSGCTRWSPGLLGQRKRHFCEHHIVDGRRSLHQSVVSEKSENASRRTRSCAGPAGRAPLCLTANGGVSKEVILLLLSLPRWTPISRGGPFGSGSWWITKGFDG